MKCQAVKHRHPSRPLADAPADPSASRRWRRVGWCSDSPCALVCMRDVKEVHTTVRHYP